MKSIAAVLISLSLLLAQVTISNAQSDKVILKESKALLDRKVYDSSFFKVMTVKKVKSGKAQAIIKKAYPGLVSANVRKANKIKIGEKEDEHAKCEKIQQQIDIILVSSLADSLLKQSVKEDVYKSISKKRSIDKSIKTFEGNLQRARDKAAKQDAERQRIADSITLAEQMRQQALADSLARLADSLAKKDTVAIVKTVPESTGKKFYIIAGAFRSEARAQQEVEKLKDEGFVNARTVNRNDDGNLRICYDFFDRREDAIKELPDIRKNYRKDAWILEY